MRTSAILCVAFLASLAPAAEPLQSGPQVNQDLPGPFHPLNVTGPYAGEKACLYCANGENPVAMIFARELTPALTALIKKIDEATEKHKDAAMGSFVVFCSDARGLDGKLKAVASEQKLKHTILAIDSPAGPEDYNFVKDADVTVVLYRDYNVKANHTFRKGELTEKHLDKVLADVAKIVEKKE